MSCAINCNEETLTHTPTNQCYGAHPAGSSDIIIFYCLDNVTDFTNPTQINLALAAGEALRIESIRFGSDLPTPTNGPKLTSCGTPGVLFKTSTMTLTDYNYGVENSPLYEALGNGRQIAAVMAHDCETNPNYSDTTRVYEPSSGYISFSGGLSSADDDEEAAFFQVTGSYKGGTRIIPTPAGVFI